MEAAQARQKSYADRRRKPVEFEVGDFVYLKVSHMKGVNRFGVKRKLAPRYVGPYRITEKSGQVAYRVELPPEMPHVSQLKKCLLLCGLFSLYSMCPSLRNVFACPNKELK